MLTRVSLRALTGLSASIPIFSSIIRAEPGNAGAHLFLDDPNALAVQGLYQPFKFDGT